MGRRLVITAFAVMAAGSTANAIAWIVRATAHGGTHRAAVAGTMSLRAVVAAAFFAFVLARGPSRRRTHEPVAIGACLLAMGALVAIQPAKASGASGLVFAGDGFALLGCLVLLASVLVLGRCFGVLPEARGLVTRGPYRWVRHPVYLGELTAATGLVLAAPVALNVLLGTILFIAQFVRMRLEETALRDAFPEYAAYASRTPRLLPRVSPVSARRVSVPASNLPRY
jgi:protein-S-isoprenylcysteine O-methyltransferase Ste14